MEFNEFEYNKELKESLSKCLSNILKKIRNKEELDYFELIQESCKEYDIHLDDFTDYINQPQLCSAKATITYALAEQKYDRGLFQNKTRNIF